MAAKQHSLLKARKSVDIPKSFNVRKPKPGFTLIELLAVLLVIGLLAIFLSGRFDFAFLRSREAALEMDYRAYQFATEQALKDYGGVIDDAEAMIEQINAYLDAEMQISSDNPDDTPTE